MRGRRRACRARGAAGSLLLWLVVPARLSAAGAADSVVYAEDPGWLPADVVVLDAEEVVTGAEPAAGEAASVGGAQPWVDPGISPADLRNVPTKNWPGKDALSSQGMWSAGQQPRSLAAWPQGAGDSIGGCWKMDVLLDTDESWPGQCMGLDHGDESVLEDCQQSCFDNVLCPVWQFSNLYGCWQGRGISCTTRNGYKPVEELTRSQRIQHGDVRVLTSLKGIQIWDLRNVAVWRTNNSEVGIEHCRKYCYSDLYCQFWQYGEGGCWVEDPTYRPVQYPLSLESGASRETGFAQSVIAGEFIQHYCPPDPGLFSLKPGGQMGLLVGGRMHLRRLLPWLVFLVLVLLLAGCISFCNWDARQGRLRHSLYEVQTGYDSDPDQAEREKDLEEWDWEEEGHEFNVKVHRKAGLQTGIGLELNNDGMWTLLVCRIRPNSPVSAWNFKADPSERVRVGDRIVSVNGRRGNSYELMDELGHTVSENKQEVVLTMYRAYDAPDSLAGSSGSRHSDDRSAGHPLQSRPCWQLGAESVAAPPMQGMSLAATTHGARAFPRQAWPVGRAPGSLPTPGVAPPWHAHRAAALATVPPLRPLPRGYR